jgi:aspartate ammonia-lyase
MRIEKDALGQRELPQEALYGIHSLRARENFPHKMEFHIEWYQALGVTKLACYNTYISFLNAAGEKFGTLPETVTRLSDEVLDSMSRAAREVAAGEHFGHLLFPPCRVGPEPA